jgi:hypothetical protein
LQVSAGMEEGQLPVKCKELSEGRY